MTDNKKKDPVESFGKMINEFGEAVSKIFDDPELKNKARDFARSTEDSANAFGKRFKDEGVREKFRDFKEAALNFGSSVSDYFKGNKEKDKDLSQREYEWQRKLNEEMKSFSKKAEEEKPEPEEALDEEMEEAEDNQLDDYLNKSRIGGIVGYSFVIFWNIAVLIFLNFYNSYIAYYQYDGQWQRYGLLTESFNQWLPFASAAIGATIVGYFLLIIYDSCFFKRIIHIILNLFVMLSIILLVVIFPFDFSVLPGGLAEILNPVITTILVLAVVGVGIETLVRLIKLSGKGIETGTG
ncbi:MAG: hypothetical protein U9O59_00060 [Actinomycetota bacterium]|nr:hypothetical protein [Actinomycetota bacterium]